MTNDNIKPDALAASIKSVEAVEKQIEVTLRLSNKATRTLHYIADVRATRYDPNTKTLTLSLSDEGRQLIPGAAMILPKIRPIDPESDVEIQLSLPDRVIKLSRTAPPGELAFETHQLSDVQEVVVQVGWADVPYYEDTRTSMKEDTRLPAARWEQHKAQTTMRMNERQEPKG